MNSRFLHSLKIVTAIHIGVLLVLFVTTGWRSFYHKKSDDMVPVEFVVEVPDSDPILDFPEPASKDVLSIVEKHRPDDVPEQELKKIAKKPIVPSQKKIRKPVEKKLPGKQLPLEEIKKLLAQGATPGDHTSVPDEDSRYFEVVRRVLYEAWNQPSVEEVGDAVVEVSIRLQQDGQIVARNMVRASGNAVMDASVLQAVNSVQQISGLSAAFLRTHEEILVSFRIE